jgi:hypothetical protein
MTTLSSVPRKAKLERLSLAETATQRFFYVGLGGDTVENMEEPGYFNALATRLRRYDTIIAVSDDDAFYAEFLVIRSSNLGVDVIRMRYGAFNIAQAVGAPGSALKRDPEVRVEYRGPFLKWAACRGEQVLKDAFATEALAQTWLAEYLRMLAAKGAA